MVSNLNIANNLTDIVGEAILQQKLHIELNDRTKQNDVKTAIRVFMRRHLEVFWFSHQYHFDEATATLYLKYDFTPKKKEFYTKEIDNAIPFLFQPDKLMNLTDLEKVAYVYKWIANNTTYNEYSSFNQTIYSVLINRNSVFTGYAKTAQYLLRLIGIESELVFGKFHADHTSYGRHGWSIVKIDDDWYHVDFCLADSTLRYLLNPNETPIEHDGLLWNYFCKPTQHVLTSRSIEFIDQYPMCDKDISRQLDIILLKPQKQFAVCKSDSGTCAQVYLDSFEKDRVVKVAKISGDIFGNEFHILSQLNGCEHIAKSKGFSAASLSLEQLTPWSELLNSHYYTPNEKQLTETIKQLAKGLIECRNLGITYFDIHYNNVLVSKDGTFKWGDFAIAYHSTSDGSIPHNLIGHDGIALGSRWFMAHETFKDHIYTESSAIYSLAMLAYFVMNNMRPPFLSSSVSEQEALKKLHSGSPIQYPKNASTYGSLSKTICALLNAELAERARTFENLIELLDDCEPVIPVKIDDNLLSIELDDDSIILIVDQDSDVCIDTDKDQNEIDNDSFAQTMSGSVFAHSAVHDSDYFAATIGLPINSQSQEGDVVTQDSDCFAQTCGFGPVPRKSKAPGNANRNPAPNSSCHHSRSDSTTYSPTKGASANQEKLQSKFKAAISSIFRSVANLFSGLNTKDAAGDINVDNRPYNPENINACVFAPAEVRYNKSFIIRIYLYQHHEKNTVDSKIKGIDPNAVKKEYKSLDLPLKEGDKLTVQLDLSDGVECKYLTKTVIWRNHYTDCSFMAKLVDVNQDSVEGTVYVSVNDVPAGEMLFTIDVVDTEPRELHTKVEAHRFSKIFISYAHQDEYQVRGIAEGCKMLGKDYFLDRHTLKAGDIFKDKILNYIDNADLFILCWSKNAAESEWVQIEREHALSLIQEGNKKLSVYPLSIRPEAPLPDDMSDTYNFGEL